MNTFAFVRSQDQKINSRLQRYFKTNGMMDLFKVGVLLLAFLFILFIYFYYVNLASTRGYFLKQANETYDQVNAEFDMVKLDLLSSKQELWEKIHVGNYENTVVNLKMEVVYVPERNDLALK